MELYLNTYSTYIWYMVELLLDQVDVVEPPVPKQFADQLLLSHSCCSSEDFQVLNVASHVILLYLFQQLNLWQGCTKEGFELFQEVLK